MKYLSPVLVNSLFPEERAALLHLLEGLTREQWNLPTVCAGWSVHDIALHLLGDDIGFISQQRDHYDQTQHPLHLDLAQPDPLIAYVNALNGIWVQALQRTSPELLCQFLHVTGEVFAQCVAHVDVMAIGGPVSWVGPDPAPLWLNIAREYTERWVHQQQIRDALGQVGLLDKHYLAPVLATFVYALPYTLRDTSPTEETTVQLVITGEAGNTWTSVYREGQWQLTAEPIRAPSAQVTISAERAWRLFTKGLTMTEAAMAITVVGDQVLGRKILEMVAIIA